MYDLAAILTAQLQAGRGRTPCLRRSARCIPACRNLHSKSRPYRRSYCVTQASSQDTQWGAIVSKIQLEAGTLEIAPMAEQDKGAVAVLLTRSFADSPEYQSVSDVEEFVDCMFEYPPQAVILVARLQPADRSGIATPPGKSYRLAGLVSLSFDDVTRESFQHLPPPEDAVYLSNMAVDAKCRRMGIARHMLKACETMSNRMAPHMRRICLHVRLTNTPASALYSSEGYNVLKEDSFLVRLQNRTPQRLMQKTLKQ